jgi:mRNA interferase RelE/StbE
VSFTVKLSKDAEKQLAKIQAQTRKRIAAAVRSLAEDPRGHGAKKLLNHEAWRIRVGDYRVIYEINDGLLLILVIEIGHRRDIYRSL